MLIKELKDYYIYDNHKGLIFYHLVLNCPDKNTSCVINFNTNFKEIEGVFHLVFRIGGKNGREVFIENNRNPNDEKKVKLKPCHGKSIGKTFMEQYFPLKEGGNFLIRGIFVFRVIDTLLNQGRKVGLVEYENLIKEIFDDKSI